MSKFEKQKADLWLRASLRNAKDENYKDQQKKVAKGIEAVAINKIYQQALHLEKHYLPSIERSRGIDSAEYKFFKDVFTSLMWAICLADRNEFIEVRHHRVSLQLEFYMQHCEKLERQFNKYATLEDLFLSSTLDEQAAIIAQRVRDQLELDNLNKKIASLQRLNDVINNKK